MGDLEWRILGLGCAGGYMSLNMEGMGRDVTCTVFAEKVSLRGTDVYEYFRPFISGAPRELQNGLYKLTFDASVSLPSERAGPGCLQSRCSLRPLLPRHGTSLSSKATSRLNQA
jgi:hypothetical protein